MAITQDHVEATIGDACRILNEFGKYCSANAEKFTGASGSHEAEFLSNLQSEYSFSRDMTASIEAFRSGLSSNFEMGRALLTPPLMEMGKVLNVPESTPEGILQRLFIHMRDNSHTVLSRTFTFGAPASQTFNTGDGQILRLNSDEEDFDIENQTPETKRAICIRDVYSGATKHEEVFELRGQDGERDRLKVIGSGRTANLRGLSARDSLRYLANPSFSNYSGTTSTPTEITDWTVSGGSINDLEIDTAMYYRDFEGDATPASLKVTGNVSLKQVFTTRGAYFDPRTPLYMQVAVFKPTSGTTGNVTFLVGNQSKTVALSAMATGWNIIRLSAGGSVVQDGFGAGGTKENWFKNYNLTAASCLVQTASLSSGDYILFDDITLGHYTQFDGGWYAAVGGGLGTTAAPGAKWLREDEFYWTDTASEAGIIQRMLYLYFGAYLPHTTSTTAVTFPDPT